MHEDDRKRWEHFMPAQTQESSDEVSEAVTTGTSRGGTRLRTALVALLIACSGLSLGTAADVGLNDGNITREVISQIPGAQWLEDGFDELTGHSRGYTDGPWRSRQQAQKQIETSGSSTLAPEHLSDLNDDPGADPRASNPEKNFGVFDDAAAAQAAAQAGPLPSVVDPSAVVGATDSAGRPKNYEADADGHPIEGMDGVDLSSISSGGGHGPANHDWSRIGPYALSMPGANLTVDLVDKGVTRLDEHTTAMDLPVSFQAGVLSTAAPISANSGTSVVAGHVNWSDGSWAPMSNLYATAEGMKLATSDGHGHVKHWRVVSRQFVDQKELSRTFHINDRSGPRKLLMVTCKASVVNGQVVYDRNLVVEAVPE